MQRNDLTRDIADRLLAGTAGREGLPDELEPVAETLDCLRALREADVEPAAELRTVRAMAAAVHATERPRRALLLPRGARLALTAGIILVLGTAGVAVAGGNVPGGGV